MARVGVEPRRGEIYLTNFDPTVGSEIRKTRPALVLQNDTSNEFLKTTIVAPITSLKRTSVYPNQVLIKAGDGGLDSDSILLLSQIRTVDKSRLSKKLGSLSPLHMAKVVKAVAVSLGFGGI